MRRNGHSKRIHFNRLRPSVPDTIALADAVEVRFIELCGSYLRIKGEHLVPPRSLNQDMLRWRQMRVRHKHGDFRNTEAELQSTRAIAQWTVDVNRRIRNQEPMKIEWLD